MIPIATGNGWYAAAQFAMSAYSAASTIKAGGNVGDVLRGMAVSYVKASVSANYLHGLEPTAGQAFSGAEATMKTAKHVAGHAVLGGLSQEAMGGRFQDGFLSAAASTLLMDSGLGGMFKGADGPTGMLGRTAVAAVIGGTAAEIGGGKFANGAMTSAWQHLLNHELPQSLAERRAWIKAGKSGANFSVAPNPKADSSAPWYADLLHGGRQVNEYDKQGLIEPIAKRTGVDSGLIRAIIYVEESQGWYDYFTGKIKENKTWRPMNVHAELWGLDKTKAARNRVYNIAAGAVILRGIKDNCSGSGVAEITTLYNGLGKTEVTPYGARVERVYNEKPWIEISKMKQR
jgi:hypothetical protein